jgi:hypothetical protein
MTSRVKGSIFTFSGKWFFPIDPRPEDVDIEDIAHSLSLKCRWTAQCARLYTIAEHSIRVANAAIAFAVLDGVTDIARLNTIRIQGLIHDAHEAYLADLASPLKEFVPGWREIEDRIQDAIVTHLGLTESDPGQPYVKQADMVLAWLEHKELFANPRPIDELYYLGNNKLPWPTFPAIPASVESAAMMPYDNARDRLLAALKLVRAA